jgi:outer membrane protein assembly factor BamE (lipoprotein component of BamABCDE complex)
MSDQSNDIKKTYHKISWDYPFKKTYLAEAIQDVKKDILAVKCSTARKCE